MPFNSLEERINAEYIAKHEYRYRLQKRQRKSTPHDIPGYEYELSGDEANPGIAIIRFSKDKQFVYSWTFKLIIEFATLNISGGSSPVALQITPGGAAVVPLDIDVFIDPISGLTTSEETVVIADHQIPDKSIADHQINDHEIDAHVIDAHTIDAHTVSTETPPLPDHEHTHVVDDHTIDDHNIDDHADLTHDDLLHDDITFDDLEHDVSPHSHTIPNINPTGGAIGTATLADHTHGITPNPHTHGFVGGLTNVAPDIGDLCVEIEGYDLTAELNAQYPLPDTSAIPTTVYPNLGVHNDWDILLAAQQHSINNGSNALADIIRTGQDKLIRIYNKNAPDNGQFKLRWQNYIQYSMTSR